MQTSDGVPPWVTVYFGVDDLEKSSEKVEGLGGPPGDGPDAGRVIGEMVMFADPDGNVLGLLR